MQCWLDVVNRPHKMSAYAGQQGCGDSGLPPAPSCRVGVGAGAVKFNTSLARDRLGATCTSSSRSCYSNDDRCVTHLCAGFAAALRSSA